ncbi:MAG: hypothetical protein SPH42_05340, partial [Gemmiger sp.]|uniref:hypothetical protein n=1 Tax=Gemmiger sp. TaxID=2049027 RepID=UPI002A9180D2
HAAFPASRATDPKVTKWEQSPGRRTKSRRIGAKLLDKIPENDYNNITSAAPHEPHNFLIAKENFDNGQRSGCYP